MKRKTKPEDELHPKADESLGQYLRRLRLVRGLNLADVVARTPATPESAHVSAPYLSQLELGRAIHPTRERLVSLAQVLQVPPELILEKAGLAGAPPVAERHGLPDQIALRSAQLAPDEQNMILKMIEGILKLRRRS